MPKRNPLERPSIAANQTRNPDNVYRPTLYKVIGFAQKNVISTYGQPLKKMLRYRSSDKGNPRNKKESSLTA